MAIEGVGEDSGVLRVVAVLALLSTVLGACARTRGTAAMGDACGSDFDCARGYCVASASSEGPVCTVTCSGNEDCPERWSCSGVTERGVVVCVPGAATPFGY